MNRLEWQDASLVRALNTVKEGVERRLTEKGRLAFISSHEILGVVGEEFHELQHAVEADGAPGVRDELLDLAVACVLGMAAIDGHLVEWPQT